MVPLPLLAQSGGDKGVVRGKVGLRISGSHIRLAVWLAVFAHVDAVVSDDGPTVLPYHGLKVRDASDGAIVLEENCPPFSGLGLDKRALMDTLSLEHAAFVLLVRTHRLLRAENGLRTLGTTVGGIDVIVVADVVHVGTFATVAHRDDTLAGYFLHSHHLPLSHRSSL